VGDEAPEQVPTPVLVDRTDVLVSNRRWTIVIADDERRRRFLATC
jgi:hypothetical protein